MKKTFFYSSRFHKICSTCDGEGYFEMSQCCRADLNFADDGLRCSKCGNLTEPIVCCVCNGEGHVEKTPDELESDDWGDQLSAGEDIYESRKNDI